ncbi:hypothetical protein DXA30_08205 [Fusobacterium ulcerans]|uniref:hypothetical protein n=1 Tax=Fusobacterium ulcerans TaxID=861 RepID=UPI000E4C3561|nr:hypothetical protein [Fusobacterium ulcerans]RGY64541.1 hypothetical protein DXA30_08205 [Fusobacterium ulcerans]
MEIILEKMQIDNIISVDDAWDKNQLFFKEKKIDIDEYIKIKKIELNETEEEFIFDNRIKNLSELEQINSDLFNKIYKPIEGSDLSLEVLKETFGERLEFCSSIDKFKELVEGLEKSNSYLFIVDINMDSSDADLLMELLEIIENKNFKKFIIIIYSNANGVIDRLTDIGKRKAYLEEKGKDFKYMTLIHPIKKRIDNKDSLKKEIKDNILVSYLHSGLYNFLEAKKKLDVEIYKNIYCSGLYNFLNKALIVINNGETMTDLIKRLFLTVHNANSFNDKEFFEARKSLIMIGNIIKELNEGEICNEINQYSKYSIIDFSINKYYKDIYTGDLFKFSFKTETEGTVIEKYGMIVSKSCHLILRDSERKKLYNKKISLLLLTEKEGEPFSNKKIKEWKNKQDYGAGIWPIDVDTNKSVKFDGLNNEFKLFYIDDFILDLCTLNSEGKIILDKNGEPTEIKDALMFKSYYSGKYFEKFNIFEKFNRELKKKILSFSGKNEESLEKEEEGKLKEILLNELCQKNNNVDFIVEDDKILLKVERIGRIYEDKALLLFQKYISEASNRGVEDLL